MTIPATESLEHGWCAKCGAAWPADPDHPAGIAASACVCGAGELCQVGAPGRAERFFDGPGTYGDTGSEPDEVYTPPVRHIFVSCGTCGALYKSLAGALRCCAVRAAVGRRKAQCVADAVRILRASGYVITRRKCTRCGKKLPGSGRLGCYCKGCLRYFGLQS